jgi:hypothetical protein
MRLIHIGIKIFQKFCAHSMMLIHWNSQDGAITFSFVVTKFPNEIDSDVGIHYNSPL